MGHGNLSLVTVGILLALSSSDSGALKADFRHVHDRAKSASDCQNTACEDHSRRIFPAKFSGICRELPVKFGCRFWKSPAKCKNLNKALEGDEKRLTRFWRKRDGRGNTKEARHLNTMSPKKHHRGRPQEIPRNWITGRAYDLRIQLQQVWSKLGGPLLAAKTEEEVKAAFEEYGSAYASNFVPERVPDVFILIRDPKFPKKKEAQINFLGDSLGGRPNLSLRRSRDICEQERAEQRRKTKHKIIRNEFYIECTCGYKGPAVDNACRKCGAEIPVSIFGRTGRVPSLAEEES